MSVSPDAVQVDDETTLTFTITAVNHPFTVGDKIMLYDPVLHGERWPWTAISGNPADCASGSNATALVTASSVATASVSVVRNHTNNTLHTNGVSAVTVDSGFVPVGSSITITVGDTAASGDATCALTVGPRAFTDLIWNVVVQKADGSAPSTVESPPLLDIQAYPDVYDVHVALPSQAAIGEEVEVRIAALDQRGNPVTDYTGVIGLSNDLSAHMDAFTHAFTSSDKGVWAGTLRPLAEGVLRITVTDSTGAVVGESNPMIVESTTATTGIFWGDLHVHHGNTYDDAAGNRIDENHEYARDVVGLQVGCESVKANGLELNSVELWADQQVACETYTIEGTYVAMLGFEWMDSNRPGDGHHNIYYDSCDGPLGETAWPGLTDPGTGLYAYLAGLEADYGIGALAVPHASSHTGFNWGDHDDTLRPLVEIFSQGWGFSDSSTIAGSGVNDAFGLGLRLGVIAATDNHLGWMGNNLATNLTFPSSGLGAYVATDLSRAGIFEAMETRSTYATTGQRGVLRFRVLDGGPGEMGEVVVVGTPYVQWSYAPQEEIQRVDLFIVYTDSVSGGTPTLAAQWSPIVRDAEAVHTLSWDGNPAAIWLHVEETDGNEAWSSPIWLTGDCTDPDAVDIGGRCP